ncbi:hypothetical protein HK098_006643 [Nowakowskiella sp. JEL0407]|nr:hypothetical protein HK098_006643 [Nowakowskiella sp. JEL0407]
MLQIFALPATTPAAEQQVNQPTSLLHDIWPKLKSVIDRFLQSSPATSTHDTVGTREEITHDPEEIQQDKPQISTGESKRQSETRYQIHPDAHEQLNQYNFMKEMHRRQQQLHHYHQMRNQIQNKIAFQSHRTYGWGMIDDEDL